MQFIVQLLFVFFLLLPNSPEGLGAAEMMREKTIMDFSNAEDTTSWQIVNDGVMGGLSQSRAFITRNNALTFRGSVSLANNGGFASVRRSVASNTFADCSGMLLQVQGDGRTYQLRLRTDNRFDGISYRHHFKTLPGEKQIITVYFTDFEPVFRGRIIKDAPPLSAEKIQQIGFLIADKQHGEFNIEIDWIKAIK